MDSTASVLLGLVVGGLGGFVLSLLSWLEGTEPFSTRRNVASTMVSVITGLMATVALVQTSIFTDSNTPTWQLIIAYVMIFGAAAGFGSMARKGVGAANTAAGATIAGEPKISE